MKKLIACLLLLSLLFVFSVTTATAVQETGTLYFTPRPTIPGPGPSFTLPSFRDLPGPLSRIPVGYVPFEVKLSLSAEEQAALTGMSPGTSTNVAFVLPFFLFGQELTWSSSDPNVATVNPIPPSSAQINAVGPGEAEITVTTAGGLFHYTFIVTVN